MKDKISIFFVKFLAILLFLLVTAILIIFLFPDFSDRYGNKNFNQQLRTWKDSSLEISTADGDLQLPSLQ